MDALYSANAIPVSDSELIRLTFWNPNPDAGYTAQVRYQQQTPDGQIVDSFQSIAIAAGTPNQVRTFNLTGGLLLAVTVTASSTFLQDGELYCTIAIQYGSVANESNILRLMSGYVTDGGPLSYPLSRPRSANDTPGAIISTQLATPNAGVDITATFWGNAYSELIGGAFQFTAAAVVASRTINMFVGDFLGNIWEATPTAAITLGQARTIYLSNEPLPATLPAGILYIAIPKLPPLRGLVLTTSTTNIDPADQFDNIFFWTRTSVAV